MRPSDDQAARTLARARGITLREARRLIKAARTETVRPVKGH